MAFKIKSSGSYYVTFDDKALTADRIYTLPDVSGSLLTSNITQNITVSSSMSITGSLNVTGSITMNTGSLNNPLLKGYYETMVSKSVANDFGGGIVSIDLKAGNIHKIKLDAAISTVNTSNNPTGLQAGNFTLILEGDGTARSVSWGNKFTWPNGAPSIVSGSGNIDIYSFLSINDGTEYVGFVLAQNQTGLV